MTSGWFDAFREHGGPTWYGENRTPVVTDTHTATVAVVFSLFFLAFLLIFPGVRRQRLCSFCTVALCLFTGAVILVCIDHPGWKTGGVEIRTQYRSFSTDLIDARLGLKIGLHWVNVTLEGAPLDRHHHHFKYNERFKFTEVKSMQDELSRGLERGLPYPILTVIQYLSVDKAGFVWGRHFRLAGYYTAALLWLSFGLWLLSVVILCLVPHCYSRALGGLGATLVLSSVVYALSGPRTLRIPFPGRHSATEFLTLSFSWCFYLTLLDGIMCLVVGSIVYFLEYNKKFTFSTFLQLEYDGALSEEHPELPRPRHASPAVHPSRPVRKPQEPEPVQLRVQEAAGPSQPDSRSPSFASVDSASSPASRGESSHGVFLRRDGKARTESTREETHQL